MFEVALCQEMKWTHRQYWNQPSWFIGLLYLKMQEDIKKETK